MFVNCQAKKNNSILMTEHISWLKKLEDVGTCVWQFNVYNMIVINYSKQHDCNYVLHSVLCNFT